MKIERRMSINSTVDETARSVEIVISTDTPVMEYSAKLKRAIGTVILPESFELDADGQVSLIDTHRSDTVTSVIGSVREVRVEISDMARLIGTAYFAEDEKSNRTFQLYKDKHLTSFSVGASILASEFIAEGKTKEFYGRSYSGPLLVITRASLNEVSSVVKGADPFAKGRSFDTDETQEAIDNTQEAIDTQEQESIDNTQEQESQRNHNKENNMEPNEQENTAHKQDADSIARAVEASILENQTAIRNICRSAKMPQESIDDLLARNVTPEVARQSAFDFLISKSSSASASTGSTTAVTTDERGVLRGIAEEALLIRSGIVQANDKNLKAQEMASYRMTEIARELLRRSGQNHEMGIEELIQRTLTSSDFPVIAGNIANKSILAGFESIPESYTEWVDQSGSVPDFKKATLAGVSEFSGLEKVLEGEEYKYGKRTDHKEEGQIAKYGKLIQFTRENMINDDLGLLTDTPREMGESAKRLLGDLAYAQLISNPLMGDNTALFDASHNNIGSGVIGVTGFGAGKLAMRSHRGRLGESRLNINPVVLIAPPALETSAEVFFKSTTFADADMSTTRVNPYTNAVKRVYEPRLTDDSAIKWYLAGQANKALKMFFLNGKKTPDISRQDEFKNDSLTYKVRMEAFAKAIRWEYLYRSTGA